MSDAGSKHRLLTRDDFDGLVSAALLSSLGLLREVRFVHPRDMEDGLIDVMQDDIVADLPHRFGRHLAFDHHPSTQDNGQSGNAVVDPTAKSTARVVYNHFGGPEQFPTVTPDLLDAVDKWESADFVRREVLQPEGWDLLAFLLDPRTGLGRFRRFRISNQQLVLDLIETIADNDVESLLDMQDVRERVEVYRDHQDRFADQIRRCSVVRDRVLLVDLRRERTLYAGNRFVKYALFPHVDSSIQVMWAFKRSTAAISVGRSIFDSDLQVDIGSLMASHGGGGYGYAGACQVDAEAVDDTVEQIVTALTT